MIKYLLFDLDGTITDSADGITNSVSYALGNLGISEEKSNLYRFVGPPLVDSIKEFYGFDEKKAEEGVRLYREYYAVKGIFENKVYPGITHLLKKCREQGKKVILATSKPQIYAKQILKHFELAEYFDDIQGSSMDGCKIHKEDVIQSALSDHGYAGSADDRGSQTRCPRLRQIRDFLCRCTLWIRQQGRTGNVRCKMDRGYGRRSRSFSGAYLKGAGNAE